jgi:AbrB family looped-hinge helix DNA binding protein
LQLIPFTSKILPVRKIEEDIMGTLATTKMSSKGQVVIPEEVRKRLNLKTGAQFVVVGENDVVILKAISPPSMNEFDDLIGKARREAKAAGLKQADIKEAIAKARVRK